MKRKHEAGSQQILGIFRNSEYPPKIPSNWVSGSYRLMQSSLVGVTVAAYIETLQRQAAPATVKQHMAAIRMLFSWLTEKGVLAMNPAREVKTERFFADRRQNTGVCRRDRPNNY
jgi:hypothetical protein